MNRVEWLQNALTERFAPEHLEIRDESAKHAGHSGARHGGGHFHVTVVSGVFRGLDRLSRHRMVYDALGERFRSEIHALSLQAFTPEEWRPSESTRGQRG
jgi:BolA protein